MKFSLIAERDFSSLGFTRSRYYNSHYNVLIGLINAYFIIIEIGKYLALQLNYLSVCSR